MGKFTEVDRARLIDAMWMTWRHDFGLDKEGRHGLSSGMTEDERNALRRSMGQIFQHNISPLLAIPEGYALVPVEPTKAMVDAALRDDCDEHDPRSIVYAAYRAMVAEAQQATK